MPLFDRYIAVDWSANDRPKTGPDSIWIAERSATGAVESVNPPTRSAAMALLTQRLGAARDRGERVFVGFDFAFGYPAGGAAAIAGSADWRALWRKLTEVVTDTDDNRSNRFTAAGEINLSLDQGHARYWGHPWQHAFPGLTPKRPLDNHLAIPERRTVESRAGAAQPVWKLSGVGAVGSQTLLGIPRLAKLRSAFAEAAVWPFETGFADDLTTPLLIAEIYPSLLEVTVPGGWPKDRAQVETYVGRLADLDRTDQLNGILDAPADLDAAGRQTVLAEEGWIVGAGREAEFRGRPAAARATYLNNPEAIYDESFAIIRREADLSKFPIALRDTIVRMIHACGMVDLSEDIVADPSLPVAAAEALRSGAPVFCDANMVAAGLIRKYLPSDNDIVVTINDISGSATTTRSAAAVDLWRERLGGSVVIIGNAPTALFRLLELIEAGAPKPAAIIGIPVGFVGAAESKALLAEGRHGVPFITVRGRRGGSAIAAAAFNAIARATAA